MTHTRTGVPVSQPLYLLMAEQLAQRIEAGTYPVGGMLPTEAELCEQFVASRGTVREAVKQLQLMGLVVSRRGSGTEILARRATTGRFMFSFDSVPDFLHSARETRLADLVTDDVVADRKLTQLMKCKPGDALLRIRGTRVMRAPKGRSSCAVAVVEIHVLWAYAAVRGDLSRLDPTISASIEKRYGVSTARIEQSITPCIVKTEEARLLGVKAGCPGLRVQRQYISTRGEIFEHVSSLQAGEEAQIEMTIRSRDGR